MAEKVVIGNAELLAGELALAQQKARCAQEEIDGLHMAFDGRGVPRWDDGGAVYSLWGRALWFAKNAERTEA